MRFLASEYVPPDRVSHVLTERQRWILRVLSSGERWRARDIAGKLPDTPPASTLRDDLMMLSRLGLVDGGGRGPGARWWLKPSE